MAERRAKRLMPYSPDTSKGRGKGAPKKKTRKRDVSKTLGANTNTRRMLREMGYTD